MSRLCIRCHQHPTLNPDGHCVVCTDELDRARRSLDGVNGRHLALLCATGRQFTDIPTKPGPHIVSINGGNGVIFV
jgi:hypothetical protein